MMRRTEGGRRETSFANLRGKCRFQVASRAQLPGTGWARAGMKFRLVQQEQAKCAHPLRSTRPGELSFATSERESPDERGETWRDTPEKASGERERERRMKGGRGGERERKRPAGWAGVTLLLPIMARLYACMSRGSDREIDLRKETPAIGRPLAVAERRARAIN